MDRANTKLKFFTKGILTIMSLFLLTHPLLSEEDKTPTSSQLIQRAKVDFLYEDFGKLLKEAETYLNFAKASKQKNLSGWAYVFKGKVYLGVENKKSKKYFNLAREIFLKTKNEQGLAESIYCLALLEYHTGHYKNSIEGLNKAENLFKNFSENIKVANCFKIKALALNKLGKTNEAIANLGEAEKILTEQKEPLELIGFYAASNSIYLEIGDKEKSKKYLEKAWELTNCPEIKDNPETLQALESFYYLNEANDYLQYEKYAEARKCILKAIRIYEKFNDNYNLAEAYRKLALVYLAEEKFDICIEYLNKSAKICRENSLVLTGVKIYCQAGLVCRELWKKKNESKYFGQAKKFYEQSLKLAEKNGLVNWRWINLYFLGNLYKEKKEYKQAITYFKKSIKITEDMRKSMDMDEIKSAFSGRISDVYNELIDSLMAHNKTEEAFYYAESAKARTFLDDLVSQEIIFKKNIPTGPAALKDIQLQLKNDEAVLEYFILPKKLIAWVVKNNYFKSIEIETDERDIEDKIRLFLQDYTQDMTDEKLKFSSWKKDLESIYKLVFKDAAQYIKDRNTIFVVPHQSLHFLPFQAMMDEKESFLVENYKIINLPSASTLRFCRDKNTHRKENILILALGNITDKPLIYSEEEACGIASIFKKSEKLTGKKLLKENVLKSINWADLIHFATHAYWNSEDSLSSYLTLADGKLSLNEILGLNLNASLVTLSACGSALGKLTRADEFQSLARAFIYAGAPSVIATLWQVNDKPTSLLMIEFYENLKSGQDKALALKNAQLAIMKKYPHPYYWAGFILIGDYE